MLRNLEDRTTVALIFIVFKIQHQLNNNNNLCTLYSILPFCYSGRWVSWV